MNIISSSPYNKHGHNQIKICVSGAADTGHCGLGTLDIAKELGREIARQGAVLVTGATTGFRYPGRDLLLTRSCDAVICGCGRIGTIHEFVVAFEDYKPIGILKGPWETDKELEDIIAKSHRPNDKIVSGDDPKKLVADVITTVKKYKIDEHKKTP